MEWTHAFCHARSPQAQRPSRLVAVEELVVLRQMLGEAAFLIGSREVLGEIVVASRCFLALLMIWEL